MFGDEGKGSIVDALAHQHRAGLVVRFNGGPQAAHHVVTAGISRSHCFSQFGSGTFAGAATYLSRFMIVDPFALVREADSLQKNFGYDVRETTFIDADCPVVTPWHVALNRAREASRTILHGTCGRGVGEVRRIDSARPELTLRFGDLCMPIRKIEARLMDLRDFLNDEWNSLDAWKFRPDARSSFEIAAALSQIYWQFNCVHRDWLREHMSEPTIFEGAQGVLLDEWHGFHPHTTWSTTTFEHADTLLAEAGFTGEKTRIGVVRSFLTRHGAGPFPTVDGSLAHLTDDDHNDYGEWQGDFRTGQFDGVLLRYALQVVGGVDQLAVTHLDKIERAPWLFCRQYASGMALPVWRGRDDAQLLAQAAMTKDLFHVEPQYDEIESADDFLTRLDDYAPVGIVSTGPTWMDKEYRSVEEVGV